MWHWDQGRLEYFQFDNLRKIAKFVIENDFKSAQRNTLQQKIGLSFSAPATHSPWRNYSRILKLMLLVHEKDSKTVPTAVAEMLAKPGIVTCDEYLHFIASSSTEPSPALRDWTPNIAARYPLLFVLKYILAKFYLLSENSASYDEIIGAYAVSNFTGEEGQAEFISLFTVPVAQYEPASGKIIAGDLYRQARESILVLAQISYLHVQDRKVHVSLAKEDALKIFNDLEPLADDQTDGRDAEIARRAEQFRDGSIYNDFDYSSTAITETVESGFIEGGRIKKTHISIERNSGIRKEFFILNPYVVCDMCSLDTKASYPWTDMVIDLHHLLPLASGTRVEISGTTLTDLVPMCPTCHRATHRYYDYWLCHENRNDFADREEARAVYRTMKNEFRGLIHVAP